MAAWRTAAGGARGGAVAWENGGGVGERRGKFRQHLPCVEEVGRPSSSSASIWREWEGAGEQREFIYLWGFSRGPSHDPRLKTPLVAGGDTTRG